MAGARQALGAQDPAWDSLNEALVPFSPVLILELWSPLLILTQPGNEKHDKAQEILLCEQKGCGDYCCALPAQRIQLERKG